MGATLRRAASRRNAETHRLCWPLRLRLLRLLLRQRVRQLRSRTNAELGVDPRQVGFDGTYADHERTGDLLVGEPLGDELRDLALGRCQLPALARPAADA